MFAVLLLATVAQLPGGITVPREGVTPCYTKTMDAKAAKRKIRELRYQGYLVTIRDNRTGETSYERRQGVRDATRDRGLALTSGC